VKFGKGQEGLKPCWTILGGNIGKRKTNRLGVRKEGVGFDKTKHQITTAEKRGGGVGF